MSLTNLNEFPLHSISINTPTIQSTVLIVGLIKIFLLLQILLHRKRISTPQSPNDAIKKGDHSEPSDQEIKKLDQGEVEMVLKSLGIVWQGDQVPTTMDADEIFDIFEERRPCLDEVREAFEVFDSNRDGVIDEKELHKVMCALGLKEGLEMENCRRMIGVFDENGDGRIDFDEFVNFMENSFT